MLLKCITIAMLPKDILKNTDYVINDQTYHIGTYGESFQSARFNVGQVLKNGDGDNLTLSALTRVQCTDNHHRTLLRCGATVALLLPSRLLTPNLPNNEPRNEGKS